jgi:hypothetical protein
MADRSTLASGAGVDELAGFPSLERGVDFLTGRRGSNQWLGDAARQHDGEPTLGPRGNKIDKSRVPLTSGPPVGNPDAVNPLGRYAGESMTGD